MSSQRGNASRTRAQKHKNSTSFKNDLYDKTVKTKMINNIDICNVCERCKSILEWKIKYKKYKPLTAPKKCTKCAEKSIKHAYHILCGKCSSTNKVCPKCGKEEIEYVEKQSEGEKKKVDNELQEIIKSLPERKRRTFLRYLEKQDKNLDSKNEEIMSKLNQLKLSSKDSENSDDFLDDEDDFFNDDISEKSDDD